MVDPVSFNRSNPFLFFRLDPGEPGLLRSARASDSIREVFLQETRNLNRLQAEASREGRRVLSAGIQFTRGLEGNTLVTRAGMTTVVSREPRETLFSGLREASEELREGTSGVLPEPEQAPPEEEAPETRAEPSPEEPGREEPSPVERGRRDLEETRLRAALNRAENDLRDAERRAAATEDPAGQAAAGRERARLQSRVERLESQLREIEPPPMPNQPLFGAHVRPGDPGTPAPGLDRPQLISALGNARPSFLGPPTLGSRVDLFA